MKNPSADTISEAEPKLTPLLIMGSPPESPTKSDSTSTQSEGPPSPEVSHVHLTIGSSPESQVKRNAFNSLPKSPSPPTSSRSPLDSPVHLTQGSIPSESNTISSLPNPNSSPARSPTGSPEHLTIGSSSHPKPLQPATNSPEGSPARSSLSSDHTTSHNHVSFPQEVKFPASAMGRPTGEMPEKSPSPFPVANRSFHEEPMALTKVDLSADGNGSVEEGSGIANGIGGSRRSKRPSLSILKRVKREKMVKRGGLGFRILGALLCLVSFSVMAANRNMGWALDSFYRYKEFRYFISVNVIGFVYSAAQAFDLACQQATGGKYGVRHPYRYYFDFAVDQMITYLLISASSSATTRIDDWQSNWGKDKFPDLASASVSMSYLAFLALALSSMVSGHALCTSKSMQF